MTITLSDTTNATLRYYRAYRPTKFLLERTLSQNDIVVFDHGLHYPPNVEVKHEAASLYQETQALLKFVQAYEASRVKLLAWRETTTQHFAPFPGGYFLRYLTDSFPINCTRINENYTVEAYPELSDHLTTDLMQILTDVYPRNVIFQATNATENFTWVDASDPNFLQTPVSRLGRELVFLPYRDFTKEVTYLHGGECTHFCSNPFLWQPIWRNIRLAIQRQAKYLDTRTSDPRWSFFSKKSRSIPIGTR